MKKFEIPYSKSLLRQVDDIENKILNWYKKKYYSQGDNYYIRITNKGKWAVGYSNDYPLQHGSGKEHILSEEDFLEAMFKKSIIPEDGLGEIPSLIPNEKKENNFTCDENGFLKFKDENIS